MINQFNCVVNFWSTKLKSDWFFNIIFVSLQVDSFILDENDMEGSEEVLEPSKFLLAAETEEGQQQLQTVDPETHARLEALLEAAGEWTKKH